MDTKKDITVSDLAQQALAVQDAANLVPVAKVFLDTAVVLRRLRPDTWNEHPILTVLADKLAHLTTGKNIDATAAYNQVMDMAEGKTA
jgi:hypothetical protein